MVPHLWGHNEGGVMSLKNLQQKVQKITLVVLVSQLLPMTGYGSALQECLKSVELSGQALICQSMDESRGIPVLMMALINGKKMVAKRVALDGTVDLRSSLAVSSMRFLPAQITLNGILPDSLEVVAQWGRTKLGMIIPCGQNMEALLKSDRGSKKKTPDYMVGICATKKL